MKHSRCCCRMINKGLQPEHLDGVGYRVNGKAHINPKRFFISDIDALAFPARHLLDFSRYTIQGRPYTVLITSRGCPQACTYCSVSQVMGKTFRARSAATVIEEIKHCREKYGISLFDIEDDNFTLDQKRAMQILNLNDRGIRRRRAAAFCHERPFNFFIK